ncbi:MAG: ATP-binding protein [Elusimicrobiota bacterium]
MSNSAHFDNQIKLFRKEFPPADGWQIYKNESSFLFNIPDLLETAPESIKHSEITQNVSHESSYSEDKETPTITIKKLRWLGTYHLVWNNESITVRSLYYEDRGQYPYFLIAVKNFNALSNFYDAIIKLDLKKGKQRTKIVVQTVTGMNIPLSNVSWNNVILPPAMAEDLKAGVETFFQAREMYKQFDLPYKRGFIFSGPAGCGKTLTAKTILATMRLPSFLLTPSPSQDRTANCIHWAFDAAARHAPAILLIEELEKFSDPAYISMVLNLMDGLSTMKGVLAIATTNHPEKIDPALLLRPSRFDRVWNFPLPDLDCRLRLLKKKAKGYVNDLVLEEVARQSSGFSMAYVQEIFASAISLALRDGREVSDNDLLKSVELLKKQIKSAPATAAEVGTAAQCLGFVQE